MNNLMEQILNHKEIFPELNRYIGKLSIEQQEYFINKIKNIKQDQLYKSPIHGLYHSEKVTLFAYLLGIFYNLSEIDMEILLDAAMYHDFKRANDFEDSFHGYVSANNIEEIVSLATVYSTRVNLLLLKAIIDYHSQADKRLEINFNLYELPEEEFERYRLLAYILKDADALDRKRFSEKCQASLNPDFLRCEESKKMIALSEEINEAYYDIIEKSQQEIPLSYETEDCFHSIGFDFFRIESVLKHGILSFSEMKKEGLSFPRNFDGGNAKRWISVVPASAVYKNATALKTFIENGISFLCENQNLYRPVEYNQKSYAILHGLPFDKSGYQDERYAFLKIDPSSFTAIFITKEHASKDVSELSYLYNTLHYQSLENKILYYLNKMGISSIQMVPGLIEPLKCYKDALLQYEMFTSSQMEENKFEIAQHLNSILIEINRFIQQLMHRYYALLLNQNDEVTVADVLHYELSKCGKKLDMVDGPCELIFFIKEKKMELSK